MATKSAASRPEWTAISLNRSKWSISSPQCDRPAHCAKAEGCDLLNRTAGRGAADRSLSRVNPDSQQAAAFRKLFADETARRPPPDLVQFPPVRLLPSGA